MPVSQRDGNVCEARQAIGLIDPLGQAHMRLAGHGRSGVDEQTSSLKVRLRWRDTLLTGRKSVEGHDTFCLPITWS